MTPPYVVILSNVRDLGISTWDRAHTYTMSPQASQPRETR